MTAASVAEASTAAPDPAVVEVLSEEEAPELRPGAHLQAELSLLRKQRAEELRGLLRPRRRH